mmetsp:Transcript_113322/g.218170  ORF Transcript_113322/g.218170 Transcript_113322/m.218170 type:complete len:255 (+) Transcript_113322:512-1276(+)
MTATIVDLPHLSRWILVCCQKGTNCFVERGCHYFGLRVACTEVYEGTGKRQVLAQGVPSQMTLLLELLDMLWCRAACSSFIHGTSCEHRYDRKHLRTGTQLQDGEEVGEVVPEHIACDGNSVQAIFSSLKCDTHSFDRGHDLNVQALWLEFRQVGLDPLHQNDVMGAGRVQPKNGFAWLLILREVVGTAPVDRQLDPILDGSISCLACSVDVTFAYTVSQKHVVRAIHNNSNCPVKLSLECVWVRAILLCFLCH